MEMLLPPVNARAPVPPAEIPLAKVMTPNVLHYLPQTLTILIHSNTLSVQYLY